MCRASRLATTAHYKNLDPFGQHRIPSKEVFGILFVLSK
jgi:hypothetical protein